MEMVNLHMMDSGLLINSKVRVPSTMRALKCSKNLLTSRTLMKLISNHFILKYKTSYWSKYIGGFKDDCKHGYGTLYLSNGEYIEGQFYKDLLEGEGKFYQTNGKIVRGIWK